MDVFYTERLRWAEGSIYLKVRASGFRNMEKRSGILTLTTDFGLQDAYVGVMKGVILSRNREVVLVDLSHHIPPQQILPGAFVVQQAYSHFPAGSVHLFVVDPGVGSRRASVAAKAGGHFFVGPDNGWIPFVLQGEQPEEVVYLDNAEHWRVPVPSSTFHGRDIFAPVAALLAAGLPLHEIGTPCPALIPLHMPQPVWAQQALRGEVVYVDHYGNAITNLHRSLAQTWPDETLWEVTAGQHMMGTVQRTYADSVPGAMLALWGSSDYLEISIRNGNAALDLGLSPGLPVTIRPDSPR
jgi:S-adenosylmethionine hydrolase